MHSKIIFLIFCTSIGVQSAPAKNECKLNKIYDPVCGSDNNTYANLEALNCRNYGSSSYYLKKYVNILRPGACDADDMPGRRGGYMSGGLNYVCASNGITYENVEQVRLVKKYEPELNIWHSGGCTYREVVSILIAQGFCRNCVCKTARSRYEWNPVCGQNNITYPNPYIMLCYQPSLQVKHSGECGSEIARSCYLAKTEKYEQKDQVCASDGKTYMSYNHLFCASQRVKYLYTRHMGKCTDADKPCNYAKPIMNEGNPVCGTDGVTYVNIEGLWCASDLLMTKYKNTSSKCPDLKYLYDGQCLQENANITQ